MEKQKRKKEKRTRILSQPHGRKMMLKKAMSQNFIRWEHYVLFNNNPAMQGNMPPSGMVKLAQALNKSETSGEITSLIWGRKINVLDNNGF